jgi:hypothetical protein
MYVMNGILVGCFFTLLTTMFYNDINILRVVNLFNPLLEPNILLVLFSILLKISIQERLSYY